VDNCFGGVETFFNLILLPLRLDDLKYAFLLRSSNRTWFRIADFELLHLALLHLMCVFSLEFTAGLNVVFAVREALDDANDIITFGVGEGDVGISFERQSRENR